MSRSIRRAQLISPFGVGALLDLGKESFSTVDIRSWHAGARTLIAGSTLGEKLRREVYQPSSRERSSPIPVVRFPAWLFCPKCRHLSQHRALGDEDRQTTAPQCSNCRCDLAPIGFVAACPSGHLQDVDWYAWAHRGHQVAESGPCARSAARLTFVTTGRSGGDWDALVVRCDCGTESTFEGLVGPSLSPRLMACLGTQPWESTRRGGSQCHEQLRVYRRGASNLYYPRVLSALDLLPPEGAVGTPQLVEWIKAHSGFASVQALAGALGGLRLPRNASHIRQLVAAAEGHFGCSEEDATEAVLLAANGSQPGTQEGEVDTPILQDDIVAGEWPMLTRVVPASTPEVDLHPTALPPDWPALLGGRISGVTLLRRLREVRALVGFQRVSPDTDSRLVPVDLVGSSRWVPGVEVFGEGVFLRFDEAAVRDWESRVTASLVDRLGVLTAACEKRGWVARVVASPRFLMLHTFAHVVMRRLAFDAGYASASLRERIYSATGPSPMAGVLIYTADSDSEGSLGGLVRMGEPSRMARVVTNALQEAAWCSADPVCWESSAQGVGGMNAGACHACALVSETSCSHANVLLDRRLLVGGRGEDLGFFPMLAPVSLVTPGVT